jgi:hypothetical protein
VNYYWKYRRSFAIPELCKHCPDGSSVFVHGPLHWSVTIFRCFAVDSSTYISGAISACGKHLSAIIANQFTHWIFRRIPFHSSKPTSQRCKPNCSNSMMTFATKLYVGLFQSKKSTTWSVNVSPFSQRHRWPCIPTKSTWLTRLLRT